jgi:glycosyltransferase involved in cell wall biosynthesis
LKTVHVIDLAQQFGGHEVMLLQIIREIETLGLANIVVTVRRGSKLDDRLSSFRGRRIENSAPQGFIRRLKDNYQLARAVLSVKSDFCLVANGYLGELGTSLIPRLLGRRVIVYTPLIVTFKDLGAPHPKMKDLFFKFISARIPHWWIVLSPGQKQQLGNLASAAINITYIENVVKDEVLRVARNYQPTPNTTITGPIKILIIGRLDVHQKGLDYLIEYLASMPAKADKYIISIVGEGHGQGMLDQNKSRLPAFVRMQPWSDAKVEMETHDVILMPSRFEGVPLVMLEAMMLGRPVVSTDLPGVRDYLPSECMFSMGDMAEAFSIIERLRGADFRERVVRANRDTALKRNTPEHFRSTLQRTWQLIQSH